MCKLIDRVEPRYRLHRVELCEMVIGFGKVGYRVFCRYTPSEETLFVLAFQRQRKPGAEPDNKFMATDSRAF